MDVGSLELSLWIGWLPSRKRAAADGDEVSSVALASSLLWRLYSRVWPSAGLTVSKFSWPYVSAVHAPSLFQPLLSSSAHVHNLTSLARNRSQEVLVSRRVSVMFSCQAFLYQSVCRSQMILRQQASCRLLVEDRAVSLLAVSESVAWRRRPSSFNQRCLQVCRESAAHWSYIWLLAYDACCDQVAY